MVDKINVRSMAIEAIDLISSQKGFSSEIIKKNVKKINNVRDESLYRELVYGATENLLYIDYMINKVSKIRTNKLEKIVLNALRLAIYETVFLRIESYATVNEYVKIVKRKKGIKAGNFINAILRNSLRDLDKLKEINAKDKKEYLSIKYSFNKEIIEYFIDNYGIENTEDIIISLSKKPNLSIRVNTTLITEDELIELLEEKGLVIKKSDLAKDCLIIDNPINITDFEEFKKGYFTIQDQASIKVSEILDPKKSTNILDLCAAPGSKSTHLAQISKNESLVVANDISKEKLDKIKDNFDRMHFTNYRITNYDASQVIDEFIDKFDYILVDAPCSGLGVIKRKPEIKLFRSLKEIKQLAQIQKQILNNSIKYLKKGGYLVYSTCTLGKLENIEIINSLLSDNDSVQLMHINGKQYFEIMPDKEGSDGFFMAKLTKIS